MRQLSEVQVESSRKSGTGQERQSGDGAAGGFRRDPTTGRAVLHRVGLSVEPKSLLPTPRCRLWFSVWNFLALGFC